MNFYLSSFAVSVEASLLISLPEGGFLAERIAVGQK